MGERFLGHYRVLHELGAGGMGTVFTAEDTRLKRRVALKLLPSSLARDPRFVQRFQREAKAVAALDHPNIVTIHSIESVPADEAGADPIHFFTMQLVDGKRLDELTPKNGLSLDELLAFALPLTDAMGAAHRKGITHRDLKPANVMVGDDGRLWVLDFGLAKFLPPAATAGNPGEDETTTQALTEVGTTLGTVPYMSPEQVRGAAIDPRTDVFSLGSMLYEMALGRRPFTGDSPAEMMSSILRDIPGCVSEQKSDFPTAFDEIIERCLQKEPDDRYPTASDLHRDLERLQAASAAPIRSPNTRAVSLPLPARPSLAILPFQNLGGDSEQDSFAAGLWADLNSDMVKISGLFLISQVTTGLYKDRPVSVAEVAQELGVRHVLEGTVRRSGDRVRITVQLVEAQTGETTWGERYDREISDLFAVQDEISQKIVSALDVKLVHGEGDRLLQRSLKDPRARDIYYRAMAALFAFGRDSLLEARRLLTEVTGIEPESSIAHVFTAISHYFDGTLGYTESCEESFRQAVVAADRALELDDPTGSALMIKGLIHLARGEHDAALTASELALRDRPSCPWVYALKGAVHSYSGQPARAIELARLAIRHTPLTPPLFASLLATSHYLCGQHEEAVDAARGTVEMARDNVEAHVILAAALAASGRTREAEPVLNDIRRLKADFSLDEFVKSQPYKNPSALDGLVADLRAAGLP